MTDLDLFCCAGGATTGLAMLGRTVIGVDRDADACRTHLAAGHPTIRADLTGPVPVSGPFDMVWASPPCTAFSVAGKMRGHEVSDVLGSRIIDERFEPMEGLDPSVWLILPTMKALLELRPMAIAMENVPPTIPVMKSCALLLQTRGYHTAVGILSAERFGVAQTRKRAFLIANREHRVRMPEPTHQGYGQEIDEAQGALFGEPLLPWVSMADALGWSEGSSVSQRRGAGMIERHGERPDRGATEPAPTITSGVQRRLAAHHPVAMDRRTISAGAGGTRVPTVTVPTTSPAPSLTSSGLKGQFVWVNERPAYTLTSGEGSGDVSGGGQKILKDSAKKVPAGSVTISVAEAARLQAFPNGYPWQGSRTSSYMQIGNAVCPPVAAAVAGAALGINWRPAVAAYLAELYSQPLTREEAA